MVDREFNKSLANLLYYNNLNNKLEREVGDYLRNKVPNPKNYSNDLRHQYVSAIYSRNKGSNNTKLLGQLNEIFNISEAEPYNRIDKQVDLYNNNIGIEYGQRYPNISRQQLLDILFNDYYNNRNNRLKQLGY